MEPSSMNHIFGDIFHNIFVEKPLSIPGLDKKSSVAVIEYSSLDYWIMLYS